MRFLVNISAITFLLAFAGIAPVRNIAATEENGFEFFENKIRPILVDNCYKCHSLQSEKVKGGLLLDSKEGVLKGGDNGPVITPGDPEKSPLITAVRYKDENLQMPPKNKKLPAEQIALLEEWVKMGAPDPRTNALVAIKTPTTQTSTTHWAFQPIQSHPFPKLTNSAWIKNPIDLFILAKLEEKGLLPNPEADKRTLLRRASFDLLGLPPTMQQLVDFESDHSSDAFAHVVDRLLASPQYGERWARYWLDIARYADTKGYVFEEERRFPYSYTYRDYVIRAFNQDLPYNRFIIEQIAADQLPLGEDKRPLAAMGFLTLGRRFLNNQTDIIDDRIDVTCRGLMGLTVGCARCHDHKFDPIPSADYYSLYGVFASSFEPAEKPLLGKNSFPKEYPQYIAEREKREKELADFKNKSQRITRSLLRKRAAEYLLAARDSAKLEDKGKGEALARERKLDPGVVERWNSHADELKSKWPGLFSIWFLMEGKEEKSFEPELTKAMESSGAVLNPLLAKAISEKHPKNIKELADAMGAVFQKIENALQEDSALIDGEVEQVRFAQTEMEQLREFFFSEQFPGKLQDDELRRLYDVPTQQKLRALVRKVEELDATHPGAPPRAMSLQDATTPVNPHIFKRGNPGNPGEEVPRQFLKVLAGTNRKPFQHGSGRLELAEAIASPENPLTARVWVNRVWLHHFGSALVRTPSDFGTRADPPTNPELLDYLASEFMRNGWSTKELHRAIMLSSTYRQMSSENEKGMAVDPGNQLYWHMNRRRLDFEATRDTLLAVSGNLNLNEGGRGDEITASPYPVRRSVYAFIERQNLPGLFRTFDFASPDTTSPQRFNTTVPQQALFLINSPFIIEQTKDFIAPELHVRRFEDRVNELYHTAFQRDPTAEELNLARNYIQKLDQNTANSNASAQWQYGFGEYDPDKKVLLGFKRFAIFKDEQWQSDEKSSDICLNRVGGKADADKSQAVIRRWIAPKTGTIQIHGKIIDNENDLGGIHAFVVQNSHNELGNWSIAHEKADPAMRTFEVHAGDTIDFVVTRNTSGKGSFIWAPSIRYTATESHSESAEHPEWNAMEDFTGPSSQDKTGLTPWQKYAQILLMSNELIFVD